MDTTEISKITNLQHLFLKEKSFLLARFSQDSLVGQSSHIYYQNNTNEGVHFKWERQPGRPMNLPPVEVIPPPTPPPVVQSLALPLPKLADDDDPKDIFSWRFWSWKRLRKNFRLQKHNERRHCTRFNKHVTNYSDGDSDAEFIGWVHHDSRSSLFSSSSSLGSHNEKFTRGPFVCSPWRT